MRLSVIAEDYHIDKEKEMNDMVEIINEELMEDKALELLKHENSKENDKLIREIAKKIKKYHGNIVLNNICIVKFETDKLSPYGYGLLVKDWDGKHNFIPVHENMTIKDIVENEDRLLQRLVYGEICHNKFGKE